MSEKDEELRKEAVAAEAGTEEAVTAEAELQERSAEAGVPVQARVPEQGRHLTSRRRLHHPQWNSNPSAYWI